MVMRHQTNNDSPRVPWKTAKEMYESIDSISVGGGGWTNLQIVVLWMQETYELNQLALKEFDGQFEYMPSEEYDQVQGRCEAKLTIAQASARDETRLRPMCEVAKGARRCRGRGEQNGEVDAKRVNMK
ncbi:hypothetical protein V8E53_009378 [Lactarius tabidus]